MIDAEASLRASRRPLVLGIGGGGDVVGALATAEFSRVYDGSQPIVGGLAWERSPVDPVPGGRTCEEIAGAVPLAPGILLADKDTHVRESGVVFSEARMAAYLGEPTILVDVDIGPASVAAGLAQAAAALERDLVVMIDVGGDMLADGSEPGLRSPLCDALMMAAGLRLAELGVPVICGVFGLGCDGELTVREGLDRLAAIGRAGGLLGVRGLTEPVAARLEAAIEHIPTEASMLAVRAFRGQYGNVKIRGGAVTVDLTPVAAQTVFVDLETTFCKIGRLARAVINADSLAEANSLLNRLGVRTELDLEHARQARGTLS
ncbi:MAG: DUF1152 domain-containing protein [Solirubrobacteraceae bacterium]